MADEFTEELVEELEPLDPGLLDPEEALDISDALVEGDSDATLLINPEPAPLGQTIGWDFERYERQGAAAHGPHMVRGETALRQWIEKCLRTHAGAHPIHPDGYGMEEPITSFVGQNRQDVEVTELEEMVREALLFHPAIKDVKGFEATFEDEDEVSGDAALALNFVVVRDNDSQVRVSTTFASERAEAVVV